MNNRERFRAAMAFEPMDGVCHMEWGIWRETYHRWREEGLPREIVLSKNPTDDTVRDIFDHFHIIREASVPIEQYYYPAFPAEVLEETEAYILRRTDKGFLVKEKKSNQTIPEFMDYPIQGRKDYYRYKDRLTGNISNRYPEDWEETASALKSQQHSIVRICMDGFFAYPRELMGLVGFLNLLYDDPGFIRELIEDRAAFYMALYEKAILDTVPDFVFIWEDMCFKNGPLLSPEMFREFMLPAYKRLTGFLRDMGVKNIIVDSDGNINKLIPLWVEGGVTGLLPFEARAGMDILQVARQYPSLQLLGGIDKTKIALGIPYIDEEINRVVPHMMQRGGYCAALDHHVHPQIDLANFEYYVKRLQSY